MLEKFSDAEQVDAKVLGNTIPDISHEKMMKNGLKEANGRLV